jgi:hypothetical protein
MPRANREKYPDPDDRNYGSGHWRPKAEKQKCRRGGRNQERQSCRQAGGFNKVQNSIEKDNRANQQALK